MPRRRTPFAAAAADQHHNPLPPPPGLIQRMARSLLVTFFLLLLARSAPPAEARPNLIPQQDRYAPNPQRPPIFTSPLPFKEEADSTITGVETHLVSYPPLIMMSKNVDDNEADPTIPGVETHLASYPPLIMMSKNVDDNEADPTMTALETHLVSYPPLIMMSKNVDNNDMQSTWWTPDVPGWTTIPMSIFTSDDGKEPWCLNHADPDQGIGNFCVCGDDTSYTTVANIPWTSTKPLSDYQPCAWTTVDVFPDVPTISSTYVTPPAPWVSPTDGPDWPSFTFVPSSSELTGPTTVTVTVLTDNIPGGPPQPTGSNTEQPWDSGLVTLSLTDTSGILTGTRTLTGFWSVDTPLSASFVKDTQPAAALSPPSLVTVTVQEYTVDVFGNPTTALRTDWPTSVLPESETPTGTRTVVYPFVTELSTVTATVWVTVSSSARAPAFPTPNNITPLTFVTVPATVTTHFGPSFGFIGQTLSVP